MSKKGEPADAAAARTGTAPAPTALAAVGALMEERRRYESWLEGLDARRDTTPPRVFARVHADYAARLEAVVAQLRSHTTGLRAELGELTARLAALQEEQQQARDERAESELRAHVGELSAADWEKTARAADERIDALASREADVETELQRTRELLADAERPATPATAAPGVPAATDPAVSAAITASVDAAAATPTPAGLAAVGGAGPDEAALAQVAMSDTAEGGAHVPSAAEAGSGLGARLRPAGGAPAAGVEQPTDLPAELPPAVIAAEAALTDDRAASSPAPGGARRGGTGSFDELAFLNSVVDEGAASPPRSAEPTRGSATPRAPEPAPRPSQPVRRDSFAVRSKDAAIENLDATAGRSILDPPAKGTTPMAANISGNNPIILKDKPAESAKTLKCGDCGAMNYPTEWYCERCGAELASL